MTQFHLDVHHQNVIGSIAFSPDGSQILSGSWDGTAKLWDVESGALLKTMSWGARQVKGVAWSPCGTVAAVARCPLSPPPSEEELARYQAYFAGDRDEPTSCCTESEDDEVNGLQLFDVSSGNLLHESKEGDEGVAFAPDGRTMAAISWNSLAIIDLTERRCTSRFDSERLSLRNVCYSEDGRRVACVDGDGVWAFDAITAEPQFMATDDHLFSEPVPLDGWRVVRLASLPEDLDPEAEASYLAKFWRQCLPGFRPCESSGDGAEHQRIAFSPDGKLAAVVRFTQVFNCKSLTHLLGGVSIVDPASGEKIRFLNAPEQKWLRTVAFSPDGKLLAAAGDAQNIVLWNVESGREVRRIGSPPPAIKCVACSPSKSLVAAGTDDGNLLLCDAEQQAVVQKDHVWDSSVIHVEFCPHESSLLVASGKGDVCLLTLPELQPTLEFRSHDARFLGGAISADGKRFVSVGYASEPLFFNDTGKPAEIIVWSLEDGRKLHSRTLPDIGRVTSVAASHDRRRFAISYWKLVLLADLSEAIVVRKVLKDARAEFSLTAFSHDDSQLLVGNSGYGMAMVGASGAGQIVSFAATRDGPASFAFSRDGKWLLRSTAFFEAIELFEMPSGVLKRYFIGHQNSVSSMAIFPDDVMLVSGGEDGALKLWDMRDGSLRASIVASGISK